VRALSLAREVGDAAALNVVLTNLGDLELIGGDYGQAASRSREALALGRARHDHWALALNLTNLAYALLLNGGDEQEAADLLEEGLVASERVGMSELVAVCLEGLATIAARSDPLRAAQLTGAVDATLEELGSDLEPAERALRERTLALLAGSMDSEAVDAARAEGRAWSLPDAVAAGLETSRR
jgi:hypothetical protein